jgi:hypothetical protein
LSIFAEFRRWIPLKGGKGDAEVRMTHLESLAVDQVAPEVLERARAGRMFHWGPQTGVTGIAPLTALPTGITASMQWAIWNGDPLLSYVFEELGAMLVSGTATAGQTLWVGPFQAPAVVGALAGGMAVWNCQTGSRSSSKINFKSAVTPTQPVMPPLLYPIAKNDSANTLAFGSAIENRQIRGGLIIPPQTGLFMEVIENGGGTSPLYAPFGKHFEIELDLE